MLRCCMLPRCLHPLTDSHTQVYGKDPSSTETYLEYRAPSSAANPYLVLAGIVAAGMDGLDRKLEPPPALTGCVYTQHLIEGGGEGGTDGGAALPRTLDAALDALAKDAALGAALGSQFVSWYSQVKSIDVARAPKEDGDALVRWCHEHYLPLM